MKRGLGVKTSHSRFNPNLGAFLAKTFNMDFAPNDILDMIEVFWKTMYIYLHWLPPYSYSIQVTQAIQSYMVYIRGHVIMIDAYE